MKTNKNAKFVIPLIILIIAALVYNQNFTKPTACKGFASCFSDNINRVIDGDTLVIANTTIRLTLVNTPEKSETLGKEALDFTSAVCPVGSKALVDEDDSQKSGSYGRIVAVAYSDGKNLNELLLENGFGEIYHSYCKESEFAKEKWAKLHGC